LHRLYFIQLSLSRTLYLNACLSDINIACGRSELFAKVRQDADQLRAAELIAIRPVVVLSGKGGCGKTEVVSAVVSYAIQQINSEKYVATLSVRNESRVTFFSLLLLSMHSGRSVIIGFTTFLEFLETWKCPGIGLR